ncbi:unnamed protein product [Clonostachys chloroleuca]|uniref:Carboxylic ester hydrolase n=1 Tax=Clonostachys chloroleuca TaxID=1926264 RepID=A0AA35M7I6_9HYPO|nr:unnamed protein product [Clonostachys chloroleuca]
MAKLLLVVRLLALIATALPQSVESAPGPPTASVQNGTLTGLHLSQLNQDLFLGVPFARPPVGDLRLRHPQSLNHSWEGDRDATRRGDSCVGYAGFAKGLNMSEDCLTLDIARPAQAGPGGDLPVLVWIYGGGFTAGGSADSRYNTSYLVKASVAMKKPILTVSINYRVGGWGFLASKEMHEDGASNIGLFDQRLALRWVKENIKAFGGNPDKITIAGESAGAFSVGYHLVAFDGNNENLFRAAILQSGTALGPSVNSVEQLPTSFQPIYDNVTETVGCSTAADTLACLRQVPFEALNDAFASFVVTPILDGKFLSRLPSMSFAQGLVADVAVLAGSTTDEGTATFFGPRDTLHNNSDTRAFVGSMGNGLDRGTVDKLLELYPDDPSQGCPFGTGEMRFEQHGLQYKRGAAIVGDSVIHAGRRATTEYFASRPDRQRKPVFSYRFDERPWNGVLELIATETPVFSTHYADVCFFFNIDPAVSQNDTNWIGPYPDYHELADLMSGSWVSFVHGLNPNHQPAIGGMQIPLWPDYSLGGHNFVFRARGSYVERDDWRVSQLSFWGTIWEALKT